MSIRFTWDQEKCAQNLQRHGLDFVDAPQVFCGPTFTFQDRRFSYGEERLVTFGMLKELVVSIVHTETSDTIRTISLRRATRNEQAIYFQQIQN